MLVFISLVVCTSRIFISHEYLKRGRVISEKGQKWEQKHFDEAISGILMRYEFHSKQEQV
jgi:hypothetical protein